MKRKADHSNGLDSETVNSNKRATGANGIHGHFSEDLFAPATVQRYARDYAASSPYKHAVVSSLIDDSLLRSVRSEIRQNIHFTPKETDIYKIHQSGDLANLDGLPAAALEKLPSLLQLRDALYSYDFREWLSTVTGAGALSGQKTDMAVNVYVPGCHLLCHDDVIGSRRVSYILYLTDPEQPWQAVWGGALRLYPTQEVKDDSGKIFKLPSSQWIKVIPPAWNQLSFFAVQPGESFHDVEEVYHGEGDRVRMAISGWFHIPQEGEEGFEPGLEEKLAERSSLQQLQGRADQFDEPRDTWIDPVMLHKASNPSAEEDVSEELAEGDLEFLLRFMTPNYLTPDTVEELNEMFAEESMLQLSNFLNLKFVTRLREWLESDEAAEYSQRSFATSRPPHKHRYQYIASQPTSNRSLDDSTANPFELILNNLLPSLPFRKWLSLATGLTLSQSSIIARKFRRGLDYQLAQSYEGEDPQLEYCLCITPSPGWGSDEEEAENSANGAPDENDEDNIGGYELYMAGDDDADSDTDSVTIPTTAAKAASQSQTGAGDRRNAQRKKADPAIYQAAADGEEDDGILVSNPASWNSLSVVLRDRGTLRFVKYVSQRATGDRWDFAGGVGVVEEDDGEEEDDE